MPGGILSTSKVKCQHWNIVIISGNVGTKVTKVIQWKIRSDSVEDKIDFIQTKMLLIPAEDKSDSVGVKSNPVEAKNELIQNQILLSPAKHKGDSVEWKVS